MDGSKGSPDAWKTSGRQARWTTRSSKLLAQRGFSIACGYADANDSARLGADPVYKMLLGRDPVTGLDLASQPTLSRFENAAGARALYRMGERLASSVIERQAQWLGNRARLVTLDLDPTAAVPSPLPGLDREHAAFLVLLLSRPV